MASRYFRKLSFGFCKAVEEVQVGATKISKFQLKNFSDSVKLTIQAGNGGNGCMTFFTDKRVRRGAPDGGCGGTGGDIVLEAHRSLHDLSHLRRRTIYGNDGASGSGRGKDGKNGGKTVIRVPCGTLLYEISCEEEIQRRKFTADLDESLKTFIAAKGGAAGKGNKIYPTMTDEQKMGSIGERKIIQLVLKTLADVGLVGFPNIGKSTFLAAVSRALPKIANYEFTTLKPSVGYVKFVDNYQFTVADIPGIIEGAHKNKGLGLEFLKHIERTKILVFMLDITQQNPLQQFKKLEGQLAEYNKELFDQKEKLVAFNKMDCFNEEACLRKFESLKSKVKYDSFLISAKQGHNLGSIILKIRSILQKQQQQKQNEDSVS